MDNYSFATLRLGKTSVDDIKAIAHLDAGILSSPYSIDVTCTQVPAEADADTYVLIWFGSDNSKGIVTEWKQGFRAFGIINSIDRGKSFNDDSTLHVNILFVFENAISRLDILQTAQQLYYHCSALPIIGIDDHSNQTIRLLNGIEDRGSINAFFCALDLVDHTFKSSICTIDNGLSIFFEFDEKIIADVLSTSHVLEPVLADYVSGYDKDSYSIDDLVRIYGCYYENSKKGEYISDSITFGIRYSPHIEKLHIPSKGTGSILGKYLNTNYTGSLGDEINRGVELGKKLRDHITAQTSLPSKVIGIDAYDKYLRALRTKPFLLLAGISGTGKSRIVRELAFRSCPAVLQDVDHTTPGNYLMVEVKPNWHDSSELLGYYSNITKSYHFTKFIDFLVLAHANPDVPFFVCLDEMNLAPVEQYFAEFLSVLETRRYPKGDMTHIKTGRLVDKKYMVSHPDWGKNEDLTLPDNLFVIGTVNMDDTTHQFSRKVIDRAMTIEMNGGNLESMFGNSKNMDYTGEYSLSDFKPTYVNADEVLAKYGSYSIKEDAPAKLNAINNCLSGTPFEVSYRVLNELCIYIGVLLDSGVDYPTALEKAVDSIMLMKILPRIEGDEDMFRAHGEGKNKLEQLKELFTEDSESYKKIQEMIDRLGNGFTRFWP